MFKGKENNKSAFYSKINGFFLVVSKIITTFANRKKQTLFIHRLHQIAK